MWQDTARALAHNHKLQLSLTGVLSSAIGATATYLLVAKRIEQKYEALATTEIAQAKKFYSAINDKPSPESLVVDLIGDEAMSQAVDAMKDYVGGSVEESPEIEEVIHNNIFVQEASLKDDWSYEAEIAKRTEVEPYIIHHDEYFEGAIDYEQSTLTYFNGDDVLVDSKDQPIPDVDGVVGEVNLQKFGYGSKDNNIVYIRNDRLQIDFEIVWSNGKYAEQVLGFIEHSHRPGSRKDRRFRSEDG